MKLLGKKRRTGRGHRVMHRTLDDRNLGTAKTGIVTETVGDDTQELVIAKFDDGSGEEAFDRRELVDLGPAGLSRGPVLHYPRHLWALLRKPAVMISMLLTIAITSALCITVYGLALSAKTVLIVAVPLLAATVIGVRLIEHRLSEGRKRR